MFSPKLYGVNRRNLFRQSTSRWSDFLKLKKARDNLVVHPKVSSYVIPYERLCELINLFRCGIAGMLGQLHLVFREPVPAAIINAFYIPDVVIPDEGVEE